MKPRQMIFGVLVGALLAVIIAQGWVLTYWQFFLGGIAGAFVAFAAFYWMMTVWWWMK